MRLNEEKKHMKQKKKNDYYRVKGYDNRAESVYLFVCVVHTFMIYQRPHRCVYMCVVCHGRERFSSIFFFLPPAFNLFHIILMILPTPAREGFVSFFFSYFSPLCDYYAGVCCCWHLLSP